MVDLQFYDPSNRISVISGRRERDGERLCTMKPLLILFPPRGIEPGTARSVGQRLTPIGDRAWTLRLYSEAIVDCMDAKYLSYYFVNGRSRLIS